MGLFDKKGKTEETVTPSVEPVVTTEAVVETPQVAVQQTEAPAMQAEVSMDNNPFVEAPAPVEEVVETPAPEVSFDEVFNATPNDLVPTPTEGTINASEVAVPVMEETAATVETPQPLPDASLNVNPEEIVGEVTKEDEITQIVSDSVDAQDNAQVTTEIASQPAPTEEVILTPEPQPAVAEPAPIETVEVMETPQVEVTPTVPTEASVEQPVEAIPTETIEEFNDISSTEIVLPAEVQESQAETEQLIMEEQVTPPEETIELTSEPLTTPTVEPSFVVPQNSIMASNAEEESIISVPPLKTAETTPVPEEITLPAPAVVSEEVVEEPLTIEETPVPVETTTEDIELTPTPVPEENNVTQEVPQEVAQEVTEEVVSTDQVNVAEPEAQPVEQVIEETPTVEPIQAEPTTEPVEPAVEEPITPENVEVTEVPQVEETPSVPDESPALENQTPVEPTIESAPEPETPVEDQSEITPSPETTPEEVPEETSSVEQPEPPQIESPDNAEPSEVEEPVATEEMPAIAETSTEEAPTEQTSEITPTETPAIIEEPTEDIIPAPSTEPVITEETEDITTSTAEPATDDEIQPNDESTNTPIIEEDETVILPIITEDMEIPDTKEESVVAEEPVNIEEPVISEEPEIIAEPVISEEPAIIAAPVIDEEPGVTEEPVASEEPDVAEEPIIDESNSEEIIDEENEEINPIKDELVSSNNDIDKIFKESAPKISETQLEKPTNQLEKPQLTERDGIVTYISDPTPTRFCNNCGIMLTDDSSICPSCGEPID